MFYLPLDRIRAGDAAQQPRAGFHRALLCRAIHGDEAERGPIAHHPFEVVQRRPVRVAAHVDAVLQAVCYPAQRAPNVFCAARIIACGSSFAV